MDREKVINELVEHIESALDVDSDYVDCVRTDLLQTVVGLLKEQEKPNGKCVNECECWDSAYERGKQDALKEQEAKRKNRLPYSPDSNVQWT